MPKRGPAPKVTGRQNRGRDRGKVLQFAHHALAPPDPASSWLVSTKALWDAYWASEMAKAVRPGQADTVTRMFTYRDEWARCMASYRATRVVAGSTGQPRVNPLFEVAMKLEDRIERLGADLGMTPYTLMRLGIASGQVAKTIEELSEEAEQGEDGEFDLRRIIVVDEDNSPG